MSRTLPALLQLQTPFRSFSDLFYPISFCMRQFESHQLGVMWARASWSCIFLASNAPAPPAAASQPKASPTGIATARADECLWKLQEVRPPACGEFQAAPPCRTRQGHARSVAGVKPPRRAAGQLESWAGTRVSLPVSPRIQTTPRVLYPHPGAHPPARRWLGTGAQLPRSWGGGRLQRSMRRPAACCRGGGGLRPAEGGVHEHDAGASAPPTPPDALFALALQARNCPTGARAGACLPRKRPRPPSRSRPPGARPLAPRPPCAHTLAATASPPPRPRPGSLGASQTSGGHV
jgi:hypothetical protein